MATCKVYNIDKIVSEFAKYKGGNGKLYTRKMCKACQCEANKKWRHENKDWVTERGRIYTAVPENIDRRNKLRRERYDPEKNKQECRDWRNKNIEREREKSRKRYAGSQEKQRCMKEYCKKYRAENSDIIREKKKVALRKYRAASPRKRLKDSISCYIYQGIRENKSFRRWESLVGYALPDLMSHLEAKFHDGMTWDNYGQWHVDHIKPIALFNFEKPEDAGFKMCWAMQNLQPLWAKDNIAKGCKYVVG